MSDASPGAVQAVVRRPLLRRLLRPVAAFGAVVTVGVAGFSSLGAVGVVDALFWLLDPTSIELHFRAHDGPETLTKGYAVVVLSGLVVTGLWIGETVFSAAFGGRIRTELREMQIEREVEQLHGHTIICGYGTFGKTIARTLRDEGRDVVVIEQQDAEFRRALDDDLLAVLRLEEAPGAVGLDGVLAVPPIDEHYQLNGPRPAVLEHGVEGRAGRPAGKEHVVDQNGVAVGDVHVVGRRGRGLDLGVVVAEGRDVQVVRRKGRVLNRIDLVGERPG